MIEPKYKVGDIVQLKSGGPNMTIQNVPAGGISYGCQWFSGKKLEHGVFPEDSLVVPDTNE